MQPLAFDTLAQIVALSRRLDASLEASARVLAAFAIERPDATFLVPADALDDVERPLPERRPVFTAAHVVRG